MRKLSIVLISIVLCFCLFMFVGCDNNKSSVEEESVSYYCSYSQLEKMEIGSELPIYPECEFDYKLTYKDKDYIIHITSLSAQLVKKNFIEKDALIEGEYYPFEVHAVVEGSVPTNFPLKSFRVFIGLSVIRVYVTQFPGDSLYFYGETSFGVTYDNYLGFVTIYPE